jgi:hypothetical protein
MSDEDYCDARERIEKAEMWQDEQEELVAALVAALERMVAERHEPSGEAVQQAYDALALAAIR